MLNKKEAEKIATAIHKLNELNRTSNHAEIRTVCDRAALNLIKARELVTSPAKVAAFDPAPATVNGL